MAKIILEVEGKHYTWDCQGGITGAGLKDLIGKRTAGSVLYHTKLRFLSDKGPVTDDDEVPLSPASVKVQGPGSVVSMLGLFCQKDGRPVAAPQTKPKPVRPAPEQFSRSLQASSVARSHGSTQVGQVNSTSRNFGMMTSGYSAGGQFQPPRYQEPWIGASFGPAGQVANLEEQALEEEQGLRRALAASTATIEADEEAQLRWALEESARMAEHSIVDQSAEEIQKFYLEESQKASKASSSSSTTAAAQSALLDSEDEGCAWDSDSEDLDLPPLKLVPDSEE